MSILAQMAFILIIYATLSPFFHKNTLATHIHLMHHKMPHAILHDIHYYIIVKYVFMFQSWNIIFRDGKGVFCFPEDSKGDGLRKSMRVKHDVPRDWTESFLKRKIPAHNSYAVCTLRTQNRPAADSLEYVVADPSVMSNSAASWTENSPPRNSSRARLTGVDLPFPSHSSSQPRDQAQGLTMQTVHHPELPGSLESL